MANVKSVWGPASSELTWGGFADRNSNSNPGGMAIDNTDQYSEMYAPAGKMVGQLAMGYAKNKGMPQFSHIDDRTGQSVYKVKDWANNMFDYPMGENRVLARNLPELHARQDVLDKQAEIKAQQEAAAAAAESSDPVVTPSEVFKTSDSATQTLAELGEATGDAWMDSWYGETYTQFLNKNPDNEFEIGLAWNDPGRTGTMNVVEYIGGAKDTHAAFDFIHNILKNPSMKPELFQSGFEEIQSDKVDEVRLWMEGAFFKGTPIFNRTTSNAWHFFKENPAMWAEFKKNPVKWYWANKTKHKLEPKAQGIYGLLDDDYYSQQMADGKYENLIVK